MIWRTITTAAAVVALIQCSDSQTVEPPAAVDAAAPAEMAPENASEPAYAGPVDGEIALPPSYPAWTVFLEDVQKVDAKQVRDIYVNDIGARAEAGAPLPDGSVLVMEIKNVEVDEAGAPVLDEDGKLKPTTLSKIFVMEKQDGWGGGTAPELQNGSWVYGAFEPDGQPAQVDYNACRACHAPLATSDYVHRLDEYLANSAPPATPEDS